MKRTFICSLIIFFFTVSSLLGQPVAGGQIEFSRIVSGLQDYSANNPREKIHLHFDKPSYFVGDTVWFKAYVVNAQGNRLSAISKVIRVDIKGRNGEIKRMILPVNLGMAASQFLLADSLFQPGYYQLRAYTQWTRNIGEDHFFNSVLIVRDATSEESLPASGSASNVQISQSTVNNESLPNAKTKDISVSFFPEGGALVSGIRSKIGFKAVDSNQTGVRVNGYVENEKGHQVALFESGHGGRGVFALLPQTGSTYTAVISGGAQKGQRFPIPQALETGLVLSANWNENSDLLVSIRKPPNMVGYPAVRLLVQGNGQVRQAHTLPMNGSSIAITIPRKQLVEGINQLMLFSPDNSPLCERFVFAQQNQQVKSSLNSDKLVYNIREQVKLKLSVSDKNGEGLVGGYSVSVMKVDGVLPVETQPGIHASLLLNSELKGFIEDANYYFIDPEKKVTDLDALMLTQAGGRFKWMEVSEQTASPRYKAETDLRISGQVTTLAGEPVAGAKISLAAIKDMLFMDTVADAQGRFQLTGLQLADGADVVLRARGGKKGDEVKIVLDAADTVSFEPSEKLRLAMFTDTVIGKKAITVSDVKRQDKIVQGTTLQTVEIVAKRSREIKGSVYPAATAPPDYTFEPDKLQEWNDLPSHLYGLTGVIVNGNKLNGRFNDSKGQKIGPMVILLNGFPIEDLSGINPKALTGVQIVKGGQTSLHMANSLMLGQGPNSYNQDAKFGVVMLTMKGIPDKYIKTERPTGFLQHVMRGYTYGREFYSPNYEDNASKYDFRSTLFWKSDIVTAQDGTAELSFSSPDVPGRYRVTLEGLTTTGDLCHNISYLEVK